jgi:hypothetical protein
VRGLDFRHVSGHDERYLMPEIMGGGAALFDMDGDGDLDACLVQGGAVEASGPRPGNRLFRNEGGGRFVDATEGSGAGDTGYGMGVACGDVDGDGDTDLYVTNLGPNALLRNDGAGRFTDVTAASGTGHDGWGTSAAFFDMDADGDLDLYVANYLHWSPAGELTCHNELGARDYCNPANYQGAAPDVLYRNEGDGRFTDVSGPSGIDAQVGTGLGVGCADFDGDGRVDVFVANDGMPDALWRNLGAGRFEDVALLAGCAVDDSGKHKAGMGVAIADVDGDGREDLLVGNLARQTDSLFLNEGGTFRDSTSRAGLSAASRPFTRFGLGLVDLDADGRLDLFQANGRVQQQARLWSQDPFAEPNLLLRGAADGRLVPLATADGTADPIAATSRAAAFGDVDDDGGLDVLVVNRDAPAHLLMNVVPGRGRWIGFRVRERTGADALGATVTLRAGGRAVRRDVRAAWSYLASNDPRVHVGLGGLDGVSDVRVTWADGTVERFGDFPSRAYHELRRGASR